MRASLFVFGVLALAAALGAGEFQLSREAAHIQGMLIISALFFIFISVVSP